MVSKGVRRLGEAVTARLLLLLSEGKNEQAIVAAARTIYEATGVLGAKGNPLSDSEQQRAIDMSPEEMHRELSRLQ